MDDGGWLVGLMVGWLVVDACDVDLARWSRSRSGSGKWKPGRGPTCWSLATVKPHDHSIICTVFYKIDTVVGFI